MKQLAEKFEVYLDRLFVEGDIHDFFDFIVILTFPIWGFVFGVSCLIGGLVNYILGGIKNAKK